MVHIQEDLINYGYITNLHVLLSGRDTCAIVDAAIWVAPLCPSSSAEAPRVCIQTFVEAACYPYCMAARRSGSRNNGLVLYNAPDWFDRVHLMDRNCISEPLQGEFNDLINYISNGINTLASAVVETSSATDLLDGNLVQRSAWDPIANGCVQDSDARSSILLDHYTPYIGR